MKYMIKTKRCDIVRRECLVSVIFSPMTTIISMISSITILLLEFLLLDVDPLVVVAVVASVRRLFLNSESVPISSSLRLLSFLSPSLPVSGPTAGPLTPLPVSAPTSPPPVPGPGPVPPPVPTSASLPPVPGPALVPPPVPVPVPVPAPVPPPVVPPGVAHVHIRPALPSVAQTAACRGQLLHQTIQIFLSPSLLGSQPFTVRPLSTSTRTRRPSIFFPSACL